MCFFHVQYLTFCGYYWHLHGSAFSLDNCLTYGLFNDSYVYHSVTVSSAAELEKLIADGNVLLIIEEQAEQE